jgi:hypothetical protein
MNNLIFLEIAIKAKSLCIRSTRNNRSVQLQIYTALSMNRKKSFSKKRRVSSGGCLASKNRRTMIGVNRAYKLMKHVSRDKYTVCRSN